MQQAAIVAYLRIIHSFHTILINIIIQRIYYPSYLTHTKQPNIWFVDEQVVDSTAQTVAAITSKHIQQQSNKAKHL